MLGFGTVIFTEILCNFSCSRNVQWLIELKVRIVVSLDNYEGW